MRNTLQYGSTTINPGLERFPDLTFLNNHSSAGKHPGEIIEDAFVNTGTTLKDFIGSSESVAIVVSDHTRPTGSKIYVPILLRELKKLGIRDITIVIALGLHRPSTIEEIEVICGGKLPDGVRVINHSATENLSNIGQVRLNREAMEADALILTGAVTFHPMAGFSGGRKSLLPGIASAEDIYVNHKLYFDGNQVHNGVGPGMSLDNPVLNHIRERTADCGEIWALNVVMTEKQEIEFAACGLVDTVWEDCCRQVTESHAIEIPSHFDMVLSSAGGSPSDISFYQSMKVLTNASRACKENGTLIIVSECTRGWEIRDELFEYFSLGQEKIAEVLKTSFTMDGLALYMALSIIRSHKVYLYSSLPRADVEAAGMRPLESPEQITHLLAGDGKDGNSMAVITNGSSVLPILTTQMRGSK